MVNEIATKRSAATLSASEDSNVLSAREVDILGRARQGATDKQIADALGISIPTLRACWGRVREKLGAVNRTHAIALAAVDGPAAQTGDLRVRLTETLIRDRVASWVWRTRTRQALLDCVAQRLFCLPGGSDHIGLERLLAHVWAPDRSRFERFLLQAADLRAMTPIEFRVGVPGDYRNLIRTVNLASDSSAEPTLLLASTVLHVF